MAVRFGSTDRLVSVEAVWRNASTLPSDVDPGRETRPATPDAESVIAKMKDGRTHLAHKAEHGVDMETGAIVSVTVQDASPACARASGSSPATLPGRGGGAFFRAHV